MHTQGHTHTYTHTHTHTHMQHHLRLSFVGGKTQLHAGRGKKKLHLKKAGGGGTGQMPVQKEEDETSCQRGKLAAD